MSVESQSKQEKQFPSSTKFLFIDKKDAVNATDGRKISVSDVWGTRDGVYAVAKPFPGNPRWVV